MTQNNVWGYAPSAGYHTGTDIVGYKVEATDGGIGTVDKHSAKAGSAYIVVDTGHWIFGKHILLPAGTISSVDHDLKKIFVARTKDDIKDAPEFDKNKHADDPAYHQQVGSYYSGLSS
jgi:hypothetical protein